MRKQKLKTFFGILGLVKSLYMVLHHKPQNQGLLTKSGRLGTIDLLCNMTCFALKQNIILEQGRLTGIMTLGTMAFRGMG